MINSQPQYAGFWTRFTAYSLDSIIVGIPFAVFVMPLAGALLFNSDALREQLENQTPQNFFALYQSMIKAVIVLTVLWAAVLAFISNTKWQATPGKRIMGIYVIDASGAKPSFLQLFWRYASLPLAVLTIQTPERYYIYDALQAVAQSGTTDMAEVAKSFATPISGLVGLATLVLICVWYALAAFRKQKTALHDILFNTRVIYGRP